MVLVMDYPLLKSIHILGVALFLGNIVVTAVWKVMADRTGDPRIVAFSQRLVTLTDFVFTLPGAVIIILSGDLMAYSMTRDSWSVPWIAWGRLIFIASGLIWILILIPIQIKQARMARSFVPEGGVPDAYWRLNRHWYLFGSVAVLLPMANIWWMVFKPL